MVKEFTHELKEKFEYSVKGAFETAEIITVFAPKGNQYDSFSVLETEMCKSEIGLSTKLKDFNSDETQEQEKAVETSDEEEALLAVNRLKAGDGDDIKCMVALELILRKSGLINGEQNLNKFMFDELSIMDKKILLGKYLVNFTHTFITSEKK